MKTCRKCSALFDGGQCPVCRRESTKKWKKNNAARIKAYNKQYYSERAEEQRARAERWRADNPEKVKAQTKRYMMEHPEKVRANISKWRASHGEEMRLYNLRYRKSHPEKVRVWVKNRGPAKPRNRETMLRWKTKNKERVRVYVQNRRARKRANGGELSKDIIQRLFKLQRGLCPCCGLTLGKKYHLDHIVAIAIGGKHEDSNMQLLRDKCNLQKADKHSVDFMQSRGFLC